MKTLKGKWRIDEMTPRRVRSEETVQCPECGSRRSIEYEGKTVCLECGFVIDSMNAKHFPPNPKKTKFVHKASNLKLENIFSNHEGNVHAESSKLFKISDATEENLAITLFEIMKIGNTLSLSKDILMTAADIYKKTVEKRATCGRSIHATSAAILYIACKQLGTPLTLNEISHASKRSYLEISRNYRFLRKELNLPSRPIDANQYLIRLTNQLPMQTKALKIADETIRLSKVFSQGKNPVGLAAAACYIASALIGDLKTQRTFAETTHVTEATIRNHCRELMKHILFTVTL